jgi:hypothetical protein
MFISKFASKITPNSGTIGKFSKFDNDPVLTIYL